MESEKSYVLSRFDEVTNKYYMDRADFTNNLSLISTISIKRPQRAKKLSNRQLNRHDMK